jgi:DNA-binding transcriptional regulator GbsR (MarR family)
MLSPTITTLVKMMETLPEHLQEQVVEKMREYLEELKHQQRWDETFAKTQDRLVAAARRAKEEMRSIKKSPF